MFFDDLSPCLLTVSEKFRYQPIPVDIVIRDSFAIIVANMARLVRSRSLLRRGLTRYCWAVVVDVAIM
jgi:hypothetical protein